MSINTTLEELYDQDIQDRVLWDSEDVTEEEIKKNDEARLKNAQELISKGEIDMNEIWNLHYLCLLHMHASSQDPAVFEKAHEFAKRAVELGSKVTRWLYAASLDRWLVSQGKEQKFGTQYNLETGEILPTDQSTTDEERAEYGVAPIETLIESHRK